MGKILKWVKDREWLVVTLLVVIFVLIRFPGTDSPLHQDEYKWPMIVNPATADGQTLPSPPLSETIYRVAGLITGYDVNFRFVPLFFGIINLLLLYYFLRMIINKKVAIVGAIIFTFSYFSILASLMVDVDGQILPFVFLLALISYYQAKSTLGVKRRGWLVALIVVAIIGLLIKLSFIIVIASISVDFLIENKKWIKRKELLKYLGYGLTFVIFMGVLFLVSAKYVPFFDFNMSFTYWLHFITADRGWFQTAIQVVKDVLYASPLLILMPFFLRKEDKKKLRPYILFLFFAFLFFIVIFDFSIGALDRYLQFTIVPLSALSATAVVSIFESKKVRGEGYFLLFGCVISLTLFMLQFIQHSIPPLHPKLEWINRVLSLHWNFLYPFSGGSGPIGFYVSFLVIGLTWIISAALLTAGFIKPQLRRSVLLVLIPITVMYSVIFTEEYLFGNINGSAPILVKDAAAYIAQNNVIKKVTVYNDNGGDEIMRMGKYRKRLYIDPKFDVNEKIASLNKYKEHYLVIDIPRIDPDTVYARYFNSCSVAWKEVSKSISATVYDCRKAPDIH